MTDLELILLVILWIVSGMLLIHKTLQYDGVSFEQACNIDIVGTLLLSFIIIIINPILWVSAIIYFTFIKSWKED